MAALIEYLEIHGMDYHTVLFMTYLYYTTFYGIQCPCKCKILIPTAHDEWMIYLRQFRKVFENSDRLIYNASAEKRFVESLFPAVIGKPFTTVGAGVDFPNGELPNVKERFGIEGNYICYCGRIDESKGCSVLFDYFARYQDQHNS